MTFVSSFRRGWVAAMILCAAAVADAAAQPVDVVGVRVRLQPPEGFTPAARYPGFEHAASGSSIMVNEVAAPFRALTAGFTTEGLASRGITLRASEPITVDGREGMLLSVTQSARGVEFEKWIAAFGDDSASVLVTGTYPASASAAMSEGVRRAVLSARLREGPMDPFEGLSFRVTESRRLKIATRMGSMLALNETGNLANPQPGAAVLVVGSSFSEVDLADVEAFSRERIQQTATVSGISDVTGQPITIDGITGYELTANAQSEGASLPLRIYQVVLPEGSHYILVQGVVRADQAAELIPEFQAVARSLRRVR